MVLNILENNLVGYFLAAQPVSVVGFEHISHLVLVFLLLTLGDKCDVIMQISLIKYCLSISAEHGLPIWSVTCDGKSTNLNTLKNLGWFFTHDYDKIVTNFKDPTKDYQVSAALDTT